MLNMLDNLESAYAELRRLVRRDFIHGKITREQFNQRKIMIDDAYDRRWFQILASF